MEKVVIIGGGYSGIYALQELVKNKNIKIWKKYSYLAFRSFIASTNARNGGDGLPGRDFISGWN